MLDTITRQTDREEAIVSKTLRDFSVMSGDRSTYNGHCEEIAELILPSHRNTFFHGAQNTPGEKRSDRQVDSTGMLALSRFGAICDSLLTPRNLLWHGLQHPDPAIRKDRNARLWYEEVTRILFQMRYATNANFAAQNQGTYQSLGAFGTGVMYIDKFYDIANRVRGFRYKSLPLGEVYLGANHQGLFDRFIRIMRPTALQMTQVAEWKGRLPGQVKTALDKGASTKFTILHYVYPRDDYDPDRLDAKGMPWVSHYVSVEGRMHLSEGGYRGFPIAASRYQQAPGEDYGRSVAMDVLPSLKTLNAEKKVFLKQGHRAGDPVLLLQDDGLASMSLKPGALNKGGWSADGKPLVGTLPTGDIQVTYEMMQEEKNLIDDSFFVSLFRVMFENPQMTATQVIEIVNEKGILIAPTIGRQSSEYIGPVVGRELDLGSDMGVFPPMPPILKEAGADYEVEYTSPLAKAMRAGEAAGFFRTADKFLEYSAQLGDASIMDGFNFEAAVPYISDIQQVPESLMASPKEKAAKAEARRKAQETQDMIAAAPAAAAMEKNRMQGGA